MKNRVNIVFRTMYVSAENTKSHPHFFRLIIQENLPETQ
jgi:hypothetical protein